MVHHTLCGPVSTPPQVRCGQGWGETSPIGAVQKKKPQNKLQRTVHNPSDEFCNVWPTVYREIDGGNYGDWGVFGMKRKIYLSFFLMEIVFVIVLVRVAHASHVLSLEWENLR